MNIRPSAAIRQNYNEIADLCRETAEPIFLTKNGEGDLVVMDIVVYFCKCCCTAYRMPTKGCTV